MAFAAILLSSAFSAFAEGIPENFLRNGNFENGQTNWIWQDAKGNGGGTIVTDPENQNQRVLEREYEIKGDIVFFDALIVRFGTKVVMDGKEKAMYLWRRIYGESLAPENGLPIENPGEEPLPRCPRCGNYFHVNGMMLLYLRRCLHCQLHINADTAD